MASIPSVLSPTDIEYINALPEVIAAKNKLDNVEVCQSIMKELNNRAWELKSFIDWEKFIQGI